MVNLSNSKYLIETPNFEEIPKIERLDLTGCTSLLHVHPSIGLLEKLAFLSLEGCSSLVSLDIGSKSNLRSLRVLHFSGCTQLEITPDFTGLSNLEYLDFDQCTSLSMVDKFIATLAELKFLSLRDCTNLASMPDSINTMKSLMTLDLCGCLQLMNLPLMGQRSSYCLESLIFLDVSYCNLSEVPDAIGELRCLERLNLEGNNFVSLPYPIGCLSSLAYLNLAHCRELQSFDYFHILLFDDASSGGRYFKTISGSRNHRSGLYIFDCPKLQHPFRAECSALLWMVRLVEVRTQQPIHFRCGFDIVVPGSIIPEWFNYQFKGGSIIRIVDSDVDDNWIGFAFCVAFEVNNHNLFSSPLPHPFYLSFESEYAEEIFDMPLRLDLDKVDGSKHLWIIYISRPHCHFVKSGAHITFKACPGLKIRRWGLHMVFKQDMEDLKRNSPLWKLDPGFEIRRWGLHMLFEQDMEDLKRNSPLWTLDRDPGEGNKVDHLSFDSVQESSSSSGPKFQLPYNWSVTEEEENENMQATAKENYLSNMGL